MTDVKESEGSVAKEAAGCLGAVLLGFGSGLLDVALNLGLLVGLFAAWYALEQTGVAPLAGIGFGLLGVALSALVLIFASETLGESDSKRDRKPGFQLAFSGPRNRGWRRFIGIFALIVGAAVAHWSSANWHWTVFLGVPLAPVAVLLTTMPKADRGRE
ncbi:MAG: hypothetical protein AAGD00_01005 [Planctomycetota bacterium]